MKISRKITIFCIIIAILPMLIVGVVSYNSSVKKLYEMEIKVATESVKLVREIAVKQISETESLVAFLVNSVQMIGLEQTVSTFPGIVDNNPSLLNVFFGVQSDGEMLTYPIADLPKSFDARKRPWYTSNQNEILVSKPYQDVSSGHIIVTISQAVYIDGRHLGAIGIDLNFAEITKKINAIKLGNTGYCFIMYKDCTLLTHPTPKLIGVNLTDRDQLNTIYNGKFSTADFEYLNDMVSMKRGTLDYNFNGDKFAVVDTIDQVSWIVGGGTYYSEIKERMNTLRNFILFIGFITIIVVLTGIFLMIKSIVKPINTINDSMDDISQGDGDLTKMLDESKKDETGTLAKSVNIFINKLRGMITNVATNTSELSTASETLTTISEEMSTTAADVSTKADSVAAAAEEMNANMTSVSAAVEESATNISMVASAAEEMNSTITEISGNCNSADEKMLKTKEQCKLGLSDMNELQKASKEIQSVTELIQDVSEQTNLLALNATIEAARAGDAGKGFAVVASEIKNLARQTSELTTQTREKITIITDFITSSSVGMSDISESADSVSEIVSTITEAIAQQSIATGEIADNVSQASLGFQEVTENVSQASQVSNEIAKDIAEVSAATNTMADSSKMTNDSATSLSQLADGLADIVSQFKLK